MSLRLRDVTHTILCKPHRLDDSQSERDRVTSQGLTIAQGMNGQGLPRGPLRAWPGGLAVARSIGDADCPAAWAEPSVSSLTYGTARACALSASPPFEPDALLTALTLLCPDNCH